MIWLIGKEGMLGAELSTALDRSGLPYVATGRNVDILDPEALRSFAESKEIEWIVNCAAYTDVDKAEESDQGSICRKLNADGPGNIAALADILGARMLHVSTDYVFGEPGSRPFTEEDPISPMGVYAVTKAEGEARVRSACDRHVIIRTAWLYGAHGRNFVLTMLKLMSLRQVLGVVVDQRGTPTWARDLSDAIIAILSSPKPAFGTFHYSNLGETSRYDFAFEIQRLALDLGLLDHRCPIEAVTTARFQSKAFRPAYSVLSKAKISASYNLIIPGWEASLAKFLHELKYSAGASPMSDGSAG